MACIIPNRDGPHQFPTCLVFEVDHMKVPKILKRWVWLGMINIVSKLWSRQMARSDVLIGNVIWWCRMTYRTQLPWNKDFVTKYFAHLCVFEHQTKLHAIHIWILIGVDHNFQPCFYVTTLFLIVLECKHGKVDISWSTLSVKWQWFKLYTIFEFCEWKNRKKNVFKINK